MLDLHYDYEELYMYWNKSFQIIYRKAVCMTFFMFESNDSDSQVKTSISSHAHA